MNSILFDFSKDDYLIRAFPDDAPTRKCRAVVCDICTVENDADEKLGNVDIVFMLLSPAFEEPFIFEKHLIDWSLEGGIEAAFQFLVPEDVVDSFYDLIGAAFDAEIEYCVRDNQMSAELILQKMLTPPICLYD